RGDRARVGARLRVRHAAPAPGEGRAFRGDRPARRDRADPAARARNRAGVRLPATSLMEDWCEAVRSLLEGPSPAVLTTYREDGSALVSPVWFRWNDPAFEVVI